MNRRELKNRVVFKIWSAFPSVENIKSVQQFRFLRLSALFHFTTIHLREVSQYPWLVTGFFFHLFTSIRNLFISIPEFVLLYPSICSPVSLNLFLGIPEFVYHYLSISSLLSSKKTSVQLHRYRWTSFRTPVNKLRANSER